MFDQAGVKIGDGNAYLQNVDPGQVAKDAMNAVVGAGEFASCKLASVQRTASA